MFECYCDICDSVWDVFEEVIEDKVVLFNCVLMLYCLGIQVFELVLVEGQSIQLYLFVCEVFNVDFDGDQMVIYVLFLVQVQVEVCIQMLVLYNLFFFVNGELNVKFSCDIIFGIFILIQLWCDNFGVGIEYVSEVDVFVVFDEGKFSFNSLVMVNGVEISFGCLCYIFFNFDEVFYVVEQGEIDYQDYVWICLNGQVYEISVGCVQFCCMV